FPDFNFRKKSAIFYIFWKSVPRRRQAKVSRKVPEWNIKSNSFMLVLRNEFYGVIGIVEKVLTQFDG
ncbi:hypothetical protein D8T50_21965, partial [Vibrio vulnificus]